jgi:dihydroneopterin aldolase
VSDCISVRGIRAFGRHGANPGERDVAQPFDIDIQLEVDLERSSHTDALEDTLDYRQVQNVVVEVVSRESYVLLERLAQEIVRRILQNERVLCATVTIAKPGILAGATPSVTLTRRR